MSGTPTAVSSVAAALGLTGGFLVARQAGRRELGGALFAAAGVWCARGWYRASGLAAGAGLSARYAAAMAGSPPAGQAHRRVASTPVHYWAPQVAAAITDFLTMLDSRPALA